jgi:uncharacterized protein YcbK (DUF882 family)
MRLDHPYGRSLLLQYFGMEEFKCPCCGLFPMDGHFLKQLDHARLLAGIPFIITSGFRCITHNTQVGGKVDSAHRVGLAVDIWCDNSRDRYIIIEALIVTGFTRIGIRKDFIHVDMDCTKHPRVMWTY